MVPAYNEKDRLGAMLGDAVKYLEERPLDTKGLKRKLPKGVELGSYEVLIVDDGSKDGTSQVALELAKALEGKYSQGGRKLRGSIKVVTLITNRGKGGSVKHVSFDRELNSSSASAYSFFSFIRGSYTPLGIESSSLTPTELPISPTWNCWKPKWTSWSFPKLRALKELTLAGKAS